MIPTFTPDIGHNEVNDGGVGVSLAQRRQAIPRGADCPTGKKASQNSVCSNARWRDS